MRRGGWFNRCQDLCEAVLACDWAESTRLAELHYAGQAQVWLAVDVAGWAEDP